MTLDAVALEQTVATISQDLHIRPTDTPIPMPTDHQEYLGYIWQELPRLSAMILHESENMEILCFNEITNLKKEHEILERKKNELEKTLETDLSFRDATLAFLRGAVPKSRHYEEAKQQLFTTTKHIAKTLMTLNKVMMRMMACVKSIMEHNTAVLSTYFYHAEKGSRLSYIFDADKTHRMMTTLKKATDKLKAEVEEKERAIVELTEETTRLKHKCLILSDELEKQKRISMSLLRESKLWAESECTNCIKLLRELKKTQSEVETLTTNLALLSKQQSTFESYSASCTPTSSRPASTETTINKVDSESQTDIVPDNESDYTSDTDTDSETSLSRSPSVLYHRMVALEDTISLLRSELAQKSSDLALSEASHDEIVALLEKRDNEITELSSKIAFLQSQVPGDTLSFDSSTQTSTELSTVPIGDYEKLESNYADLLNRFTQLESTSVSQQETIDNLTTNNNVMEDRWRAVCDIIQSIHAFIPPSFFSHSPSPSISDPVSVLDTLTRYLVSVPDPRSTTPSSTFQETKVVENQYLSTIKQLESDLVASRVRVMELENKVHGWSITPDLIDHENVLVLDNRYESDENSDRGGKKERTEDQVRVDATRKEAKKMLELNLCTMEELEVVKDELRKMKSSENEMKEVQKWVVETLNVIKNEKNQEKVVEKFKKQLSRFVNTCT